MGDNHEKQKVVLLANITIYNGVREGALQTKGKRQRGEVGEGFRDATCQMEVPGFDFSMETRAETLAEKTSEEHATTNYGSWGTKSRGGGGGAPLILETY